MHFSLALPLFAQGIMPRGMTNLAESILEIFSGRLVQIIFAIFFCGAAVAYGFNKDNEKVKRNCIAIGIASAMICSASAIVGAVWSASG
jgi:hypothetical protein